jgi:HK97 family phage major capsid protein
VATTRATLTPALTPDAIGELIVAAVVEASLAAEVATVYTTDRAQLIFPVITDDLDSHWIGEAQPIVLSDLGTTEVPVIPAKVIAATRVSNETVEDVDPTALDILGESIGRSIAAKVDAAAFGSTPAPAPAGLGALTGVTNVGTTDLTDLDVFHEAFAAVRQVGATPTSVLLSPQTALRLAVMKETGSADARKSLLQPDPTAPTTYAVAGIPLVVSRHVADDVAFVVDRARLALVIRKQAELVVDRSVFAVTRESLVLGEARVGWACLHPAAVARITIAAPAPAA